MLKLLPKNCGRVFISGREWREEQSSNRAADMRVLTSRAGSRQALRKAGKRLLAAHAAPEVIHSRLHRSKDEGRRGGVESAASTPGRVATVQFSVVGAATGMVAFPAAHVQFARALHFEHDPESANRFSEKIMLQTDIWTAIRFNSIGSSSGSRRC
jgi:hypothetical protein